MIKHQLNPMKIMAALVAVAVTPITSVQAATVNVTEQQYAIENSMPSGGPYRSAFFTESVDGTTSYTAMSGFSGTVQAGTASSTTTSGTISITGNSTAAGNWTDGNGIPTGITLSLDAAFTVSTTSGNYLTLPGTAGNGIGVVQSTGTIGSMDVGESLSFTGISISSVLFSGTLADSGYSFAPGTVSGAAINVFRSNNFNESTAGALLTDSLGNTWGFGLTSGTEQSGAHMDNDYNTGHMLTTSTLPVGDFTFTTQSGSWNLKGVGFGYNVSYDITPVPEPGTLSLAMLGSIISMWAVRKKQA